MFTTSEAAMDGYSNLAGMWGVPTVLDKYWLCCWKSLWEQRDNVAILTLWLIVAMFFSPVWA